MLLPSPRLAPVMSARVFLSSMGVPFKISDVGLGVPVLGLSVLGVQRVAYDGTNVLSGFCSIRQMVGEIEESVKSAVVAPDADLGAAVGEKPRVLLALLAQRVEPAGEYVCIRKSGHVTENRRGQHA